MLSQEKQSLKNILSRLLGAPLFLKTLKLQCEFMEMVVVLEFAEQKLNRRVYDE